MLRTDVSVNWAFIGPTLFPELTDDEIEQVARAVQHAVAELE